jgi:hypothetical protein
LVWFEREPIGVDGQSISRILKKRRRSPRLWIGALSDEVR